MRTASAFLILLTLSCANLAVYEKQELDTLYFGTQKPEGGVVSDAEWQQFLSDEITSRFPSGDEMKIAAIIDLYKKRFAQEAVFRVRSDVWMPYK
jgi:hypothetical protein